MDDVMTESLPEGMAESVLDRRSMSAVKAAVSANLLDLSSGQLDDLALLVSLITIVMPRNEAPEELAGRILSQFGSVASLLSAPEDALRGVRGVGTHMVAALRLFREAALRLHRSRLQADSVLADRASLYAYLTARLAREVVEQFYVIFLGEGDRLIADEAQARGTVNHTPVYPREVVRRALELNASAIILVHNHPGGDPTPSRDDLVMTQNIVAAGSVLGIAVRDHIIVGNGRRHSFAEAGQL
ncbi:MAG: DNA repair protein RadC [Acetobacter sp.]|jgi:DNA repair protein RadC|nr:DNA repair protein RadC [Acetobacter sp.]MCI1372554.1 DNA repair protein RadC [Acetobacter sp.]MCI1528327.1 DNA repair protein RadC [Acetobacter sp.]MCI1701046.1 DNA repair protein RadC [Acetobacter sp.]